MSSTPLADLSAAGVSIWLDDLSRQRIMSGNLAELIEQKHVPIAHQTHAQLHPAALAVRNLVHMPVEVDVEDIQEPVPPLLVPVSSHGIEKI